MRRPFEYYLDGNSYKCSAQTTKRKVSKNQTLSARMSANNNTASFLPHVPSSRGSDNSHNHNPPTASHGSRPRLVPPPLPHASASARIKGNYNLFHSPTLPTTTIHGSKTARASLPSSSSSARSHLPPMSLMTEKKSMTVEHHEKKVETKLSSLDTFHEALQTALAVGKKVEPPIRSTIDDKPKVKHTLGEIVALSVSEKTARQIVPQIWMGNDSSDNMKNGASYSPVLVNHLAQLEQQHQQQNNNNIHSTSLSFEIPEGLVVRNNNNNSNKSPQANNNSLLLPLTTNHHQQLLVDDGTANNNNNSNKVLMTNGNGSGSIRRAGFNNNNINGARSISSWDDMNSNSYLNPFVSKLALESFSEGETDVTRRLEGAVMFVDISGYSKIFSALQKHGPFAMSNAVNGYLEKILEIAVGKYKADCISFLGDAVLLFFKSSLLKTKNEENFGGGGEFGTNESDGDGDSDGAGEDEKCEKAKRLRRKKLAAASFRAALCSMELQKRCGEQNVVGTEHTFRIHIAVAAGLVTSTIYTNPAMKSMQSCYQVLSGPAMKEVAPLVDVAKSGEVCLSASTLTLVREHEATLIEKRQARKLKILAMKNKNKQHQQRNDDSNLLASPSSGDAIDLPAGASSSSPRQHSGGLFEDALQQSNNSSSSPPSTTLERNLHHNNNNNQQQQLGAVTAASQQQSSSLSNPIPKVKIITHPVDEERVADLSSSSLPVILKQFSLVHTHHHRQNRNASRSRRASKSPLRPSSRSRGDDKSENGEDLSSTNSTPRQHPLIQDSASTSMSEMFTNSFGGDDSGGGLFSDSQNGTNNSSLFNNLGLGSSTGSALNLSTTSDTIVDDEDDDEEKSSSSNDGDHSDDDDDSDGSSTFSSSDLDDDFVSEAQRLRQDKLIHPAVVRKVSSSPTATQIAELRFLTVLFIYRKKISSPAHHNNRRNKKHQAEANDADNDNEDESTQVFTANWISEVQEILDAHRCPILQITDNDKGLQIIACISLFVADDKGPSRGIEICRELEVRGVPAHIGLASGTCFVGVVGHPRLGCRYDITGAPAVRAARLMSHAIKNNFFMLCDSSIAEFAEDNSILTPLGEISVKGSSAPVQIFTHTTFDPHILDALVPPPVSCVKVNVKATRRIVSFLRDRVYRDPFNFILNEKQQKSSSIDRHLNLVHACVVAGPLGSGKLRTILNALGLFNQEHLGAQRAMESGKPSELFNVRARCQQRAFAKAVMVCSEKNRSSKLQIGYFIVRLVRNMEQLSSLETDAENLEYALNNKHVLRAVSLCGELMKNIIMLGVRLAIIVRKANYLDDSSWAMIKFVMQLHTTIHGIRKNSFSCGAGNVPDQRNDDSEFSYGSSKVGSIDASSFVPQEQQQQQPHPPASSPPTSPLRRNVSVLASAANATPNKKNSTSKSSHQNQQQRNCTSLFQRESEECPHNKQGKLLLFFTVTPTMLTSTFQEIAKKLPSDQTAVVKLERMSTQETAGLIEHIVGWKPLPSFVPLVAEKSGGIVQCAATLLESILHHRSGFEEVTMNIDKEGCYLSDDCAHIFDRVAWMTVNPSLAAKNLGEYDALAVRPHLQMILRIVAEATSHAVWGVASTTLLEVVCLMLRRSKNLDTMNDFNRNIKVLKQLELIREAPTATESLKQFYIGNPVLHDVVLTLTPPVQRKEIAKGLAQYFIPVIPCPTYHALISGWYLARSGDYDGADKHLSEGWKRWKSYTDVNGGAQSDEVKIVLDRYARTFQKIVDFESVSQYSSFRKWFDYSFPNKTCSMNQQLVRVTLIPLMNMKVPISIGKLYAVLEAAGRLLASITFKLRAGEQPEAGMLNTLSLYIQLVFAGTKQIVEIMLVDSNNKEENDKNEAVYPVSERQELLKNIEAMRNRIIDGVRDVKRTYCYIEGEEGNDEQQSSENTPEKSSTKESISTNNTTTRNLRPTKEEFLQQLKGKLPETWAKEVDRIGLSAAIDSAKQFGIYIEGMERFEKGYKSPEPSSTSEDFVPENNSNNNNHTMPAEKLKARVRADGDYLKLDQQEEFFEAEKEEKKKANHQHHHQDRDHNQHVFAPSCPTSTRATREAINSQWVSIARDFYKFFGKPSPAFKKLCDSCEEILGGKNSVCKRPRKPANPVVTDPLLRKALMRGYGQCVGAREMSPEEWDQIQSRKLHIGSSSNQKNNINNSNSHDLFLSSAADAADAHTRSQIRGTCTVTAMLDERFIQKECILRGLVPLACVDTSAHRGNVSLCEVHDRLLKKSTESVEAFTSMMYVMLSLALPEKGDIVDV